MDTLPTAEEIINELMDALRACAKSGYLSDDIEEQAWEAIDNASYFLGREVE